MRKRQAKKRPLLPDPKFNDQLVTRFVNNLMWDGYAARWSLAPVLRGHYLDATTPAAVAEFNAPYEDLYDRFRVIDLPSGAAHPTDYLVDADGVVFA